MFMYTLGEWGKQLGEWAGPANIVCHRFAGPWVGMRRRDGGGGLRRHRGRRLGVPQELQGLQEQLFGGRWGGGGRREGRGGRGQGRVVAGPHRPSPTRSRFGVPGGA